MMAAKTIDIYMYRCANCSYESNRFDIMLKHQCDGNDDSDVTLSSMNTASTSSSSSTAVPLHIDTTSDDNTCCTPVFWSERATRILLTEIKKREEATNKGKNTKKKMWTDISEELKKQGFCFNWEQVKGKWNTLIAALKRTNDNNKKSGSERKTCAFQEELEDILQGNPTIKPKASAVAGTSIYTSIDTCSTTDNKRLRKMNADDNNVDLHVSDESDDQSQKQVKKKRKSGSTEVLDVLTQYIAEQKRVKEEERNERKKMHEDKMTVFKELVKEMKK